jgi:hypothetical protein
MNLIQPRIKQLIQGEYTMNVTRRIIPFILAPTLFATIANPSQADEFTVNQTNWDKNTSNLLAYQGQDEKGTLVNAIWFYRFNKPGQKPIIRRISTSLGGGIILIPRSGDTNKTKTNNNSNQSINNPPTINGRPNRRVNEGNAYRFKPRAIDADGDNLTFSISNRPSWARFNKRTGLLSGRPGANAVGTYSNIVITVSDGTDTASLESFNLTVKAIPQPTTGDVTLSWAAPSTRVDGSVLSLSQIAGYKIYMGESANRLDLTLELEDGTLDHYVMEDLDNGTYYFAVTAYDTAGRESHLSNIVAKKTM